MCEEACKRRAYSYTPTLTRLLIHAYLGGHEGLEGGEEVMRLVEQHPLHNAAMDAEDVCAVRAADEQRWRRKLLVDGVKERRIRGV